MEYLLNFVKCLLCDWSIVVGAVLVHESVTSSRPNTMLSLRLHDFGVVIEFLELSFQCFA